MAVAVESQAKFIPQSIDVTVITAGSRRIIEYVFSPLLRCEQESLGLAVERRYSQIARRFHVLRFFREPRERNGSAEIGL